MSAGREQGGHAPIGGRGLGLALVSSATFGISGSFAGSLLASGWTPASAVTARVVVAALVLTVPALLALRRSGGLPAGAARPLATYGVVAVAGAQLCYFNAVETLPVAIALLLEYGGVLLVVGWLWATEGRRPTRAAVVGAAVAVAGLAMVLDLLGAGGLDPTGVLWGLGAAVGLATYFVLSSRGDAGLPPLVVAWGGLSVGGTTLLAAGALGVVPLAAPRTDVVLLGRATSWLVPVLGLSLVAAVVAYLTGIAAARALGATMASFLGLTEVLFSVAFAWLLLDQGLAGGQLVGGALVLAGVALVRIDDLRRAGVTPLVPERALVVDAA